MAWLMEGRLQYSGEWIIGTSLSAYKSEHYGKPESNWIPLELIWMDLQVECSRVIWSGGVISH